MRPDAASIPGRLGAGVKKGARRSGTTALMLAGGGVAHVSGGVGTLLLYLAQAWRDRPDAPMMQIIDTRGAGGIAGGAITFLRAVWGVLRARAAGHPFVVHAHMTTRGSVVRKCLLCTLSRLLGLPTVIHQHGADFHDFFRRQTRPFQAAIRFVLNGARRVIVLGEASREFLIREVGVRPGKLCIVLNGVAAPKLPAPAAKSGPFHILFLGRLGPRKGVPELIEALADPRFQTRSWRATLAGDGEVARFEQQAAARDLSGRIAFPGWQDRAATEALLRDADLLVLPSHHEAMPIAVLEALAHGVAVVTTPVGVVPEILTDGLTALLVPPGAPELLADAMLRLMDNPGDRERIAAGGHAVFASKLDIAAVADSVLALYRAAGLRWSAATP